MRSGDVGAPKKSFARVIQENLKVKILPSSTFDLTLMVPLCILTIRHYRFNPIPEPFSFVVKIGINALKLKQFRNEISGKELEKIVSLIQEHEKRGVFYRPVLDWPQVFSVAFDLSNKHTQYCGSRPLDILHVGAALTMKAETFLTFDARQAQLADKTGLKTINLS